MDARDSLRGCWQPLNSLTASLCVARPLSGAVRGPTGPTVSGAHWVWLQCVKGRITQLPAVPLIDGYFLREIFLCL